MAFMPCGSGASSGWLRFFVSVKGEIRHPSITRFSGFHCELDASVVDDQVTHSVMRSFPLKVVSD
jgi:hypothetical protein